MDTSIKNMRKTQAVKLNLHCLHKTALMRRNTEVKEASIPAREVCIEVVKDREYFLEPETTTRVAYMLEWREMNGWGFGSEDTLEGPGGSEHHEIDLPEKRTKTLPWQAGGACMGTVQPTFCASQGCCSKQEDKHEKEQKSKRVEKQRVQSRSSCEHCGKLH
eukprot:1159800-Pelagomonas_calceolata.AAC.7